MVAAPPPAVTQIAQRAAGQERGFAVYRLHRVFDVWAGPMRRHDDLVLAVASEDGRTIRVRVLRALTGGKSESPQAIADIARRYEHPSTGDLFHRPFDPAYMNEYAYEAADPQTYRFSSSVQDGAHGTGTMHLDAAGDVVSYEFSPNVLPQYARSGTVTFQRAQVAPGYWALTRETHQYRGRYFIFGGGATVNITYDSYTRYPDSASAMRALDGMRP